MRRCDRNWTSVEEKSKNGCEYTKVQFKDPNTYLHWRLWCQWIFNMLLQLNASFGQVLFFVARTRLCLSVRSGVRDGGVRGHFMLAIITLLIIIQTRHAAQTSSRWFTARQAITGPELHKCYHIFQVSGNESRSRSSLELWTDVSFLNMWAATSQDIHTFGIFCRICKWIVSCHHRKAKPTSEI